MAGAKDPMELLEGHPFEHLLTPDEKRRIDARVEELVAADAVIKEIRLACGVAQQDVALRMGVSKSAVAQLEGRDIETMQVGTLNRYFAALGYRIHIDLERIDR